MASAAPLRPAARSAGSQGAGAQAEGHGSQDPAEAGACQGGHQAQPGAVLLGPGTIPASQRPRHQGAATTDPSAGAETDHEPQATGAASAGSRSAEAARAARGGAEAPHAGDTSTDAGSACGPSDHS